ncbi:MAG: RluA family pseudouridine synthase [Spongiibacteraceae bacterium]|jgi:tRNA pseudouridine32 synthase/23S rRNA pseudouridine746 synthase|nr:RluA family pseudouridine synthase [Spongiibacteraceae bacterium]
MSSLPFAPPRCFLPPKVVHADTDILVVDKASGVLSVPGRDINNRDSLVSRLEPDYGQVRVVHRLDFDTSGLIVFARHAAALSNLSKQFQARTVDKEYEAVVWGLIEQDEGSVDLPLALDWENRPRHRVDHDQGKPSLTHYVVKERMDNPARTRVTLLPVTGRSHQLRLHMEALGHSILGCPFYAPPAAQAAADRLLLHAAGLGFDHPASGERMNFYSPAPF